MYYIYELINLMGTVEYVGQSKQPEQRFYEHVWKKPDGMGQGKFYKRQDISIHIVATYATKTETLQAEYGLQVYWGLPTDREKTKNCNQPKGSKNSQSKLIDQDVREIKKMLAQKITHSEIAKKFNVGRPCITLISRGKSWNHVT